MDGVGKPVSSTQLPPAGVRMEKMATLPSGQTVQREVDHAKPSFSGAIHSNSDITAIFQQHREKLEASLNNSKEFNQLKEKFTKVAEKEFDKIYAANFQGKQDSVREAFIEKRAQGLAESLLKSVDIKHGAEVVDQLQSSWKELLTQMFPKASDFKAFDENHPFGPNQSTQIYLKSIDTQVVFQEKDGRLSATVGAVTYQTKEKGLKGILKLQSQIYLGTQLEVDGKIVAKCHKQALENLSLDGHKGGYLHLMENLMAKEERTKVGIQTHETLYEATKVSAYEIPKMVSPYSDAVAIGTSVTGGVAIEFGALAIAEGLYALSEALQQGVSDKQFLKLYSSFKAEVDHANPNLSDVDKFNLHEVEQVAKAMREYGKVKSLATAGGLHVLLGSAKILAGTGMLTHVSTLAAAGTGAAGGLLIVSGSLEMAEACHKLRKLEKRSATLEAVEESIAGDSQGVDERAAGLVHSFVEMQADMIEDKKMREHLNLTSGGGMVCGGTLLVATTVAGVAGAGSFGIGAAAVLGGVALFYVGGQGYLLYKDHKIEELQTKLLAQDLAILRAARDSGVQNPYQNMQSTAGKLMELYQAVQHEHSQKGQGSPTPISDHVVQQYMGMQPEQFLAAMKDMDQKFVAALKDENVVSTGMFLKHEGLAKATKNSASHAKASTLISGYKLSGALADFVQSKKGTKQAQIDAASDELAAKQQQRAQKVVLQEEAHQIEKEEAVRIKEAKVLGDLVGKIDTAQRKMQATTLEIAKESDPRVKHAMTQAQGLSDELLHEALALAKRQKPVWEEQTNKRYQSEAAVQSIEKEIQTSQASLEFALRGNKVPNRVETYNTLLQTVGVLKEIKSEAEVAGALLKGVVGSLREDFRAQYAIKDKTKKLQSLSNQ